MADFLVTEIQSLIYTALFKAGTGKTDKTGFEILARDIREKLPSTPFGVTLTYRYLRESIFDKLNTALKNGETTIGFNNDYIDTLCQYTDYNGFLPFQEQYRKLEPEFKEISTRVLPVLILNASQDPTYTNEITNLTNLNGLDIIKNTDLEKREPEELSEKVLFAIKVDDQSFPNDDHIQNQLSEWATKVPFPLFHYYPDKELKPVPLTAHTGVLLQSNHLYIFFALLRMHLDGNLNYEDDAARSLPQTMKVKNVGSLVLGNSKFKAKYMANRDLHITIKKKK